MSSNIYQGWEAQQKLLDAYQKAWKRDEHGPLDRPRIGIPLFFGIGPRTRRRRKIMPSR